MLLTIIQNSYDIRLTSDAVERARRIGPFRPSRVRSLVAEFARSNSHDLILQTYPKSSMEGVSVGADFAMPVLRAYCRQEIDWVRKGFEFAL